MAPPRRPPPIPVAPLDDYLHFESTAFQFNKEGGHNTRVFDALCGENPPTITDGYAKWAVIDRPLRQGVTVPQGFNPARVQIEIRFGIWDGRFGRNGWDTSGDAGQKVEDDIDCLHWMAGGNEIAGPSPVVRVNAFRAGTRNRTHLFPKQYWGVPWVIDGGIQWGKSLRRDGGLRVYQEATFVLLGYNSFGLPPPTNRTSTLAGGYFRATKAVRTALAIAGASSSEAPESLIFKLASQILKDHHNNPCRGTRLHLTRKSQTFQIPVGTAVWVPSHLI